VCVCVCVCVYIYIYNSPTNPLAAFAYMCVCVCVCVCVYIYIFIAKAARKLMGELYVYIYIYIHTHIYHPINGNTQNFIILVQLAPLILARRRKKRNILRLQIQLCKHWKHCTFRHHTDMSKLLFDCYSSILWSTSLWYHAGKWVPMFLRTYCLPLHGSTLLPGHMVS